MDSKQTMNMIKKDSKRIQPLYYRDDKGCLWVGNKYAVYRLDDEVITFSDDWVERTMKSMLESFVKNLSKAETTELTPILYELYSTSHKGNILCKALLSENNFGFVQSKYLEPLLKEKGCWKLLTIKFTHYVQEYVLFIDDAEEIKALIAGIGRKTDDNWNSFIELAALMKGGNWDGNQR